MQVYCTDFAAPKHAHTVWRKGTNSAVYATAFSELKFGGHLLCNRVVDGVLAAYSAGLQRSCMLRPVHVVNSVFYQSCVATCSWSVFGLV